MHRLLRAGMVIATAACAVGMSGDADPISAVAVRDAAPRPGLGATPSAGDVAASERAFAVDLSRGLGAEQHGNLVFSPVSVYDALALLYPGAHGSSAGDIAAVLRDTASPAELLAGVTELAAELQASGRVSVARSAWLQQHLPLEAPYQALLTQAGAPPQPTDFSSDPEAARQGINAWVRDHTDGHIAALFPPGSIGPYTRLVLASALALDAQWQMRFPPTATAPSPFHGASRTMSVPTMHVRARLSYGSGPGYQAVALPYTGGRLSALVVLPDSGVDPITMVARLGAITSGMRAQSVALALPRLEISTSLQLNTALGALGLRNIFDPATADLSGIAGPPGYLYVSQALHDAWLRVDERGTQASAATGISVSVTAAEAESSVVVLNVDHPYLFVVRDNDTGVPVLIARVTQPG